VISTSCKQVYRTSNSGGGEISTVSPVGGSAEVRLAQMSEELRQLRGTLEQIQFANRQNATDLKNFPTTWNTASTHSRKNKLPPPSRKLRPPCHQRERTARRSGVDHPREIRTRRQNRADARARKPALTGNDFPDANAHYSYAFKLLNDKKYPDAAASFDAFVKKYPNDPLTANAYYWLGESYYARGDFTRSAEASAKASRSTLTARKPPTISSSWRNPWAK